MKHEKLILASQMAIMNGINYTIMSLEKNGLTNEAKLTIEANNEQILNILKMFNPTKEKISKDLPQEGGS